MSYSSYSKNKPIIFFLKSSFLLHILIMKDFALSELPSHLPLSFPLSLNGVGSLVASVTLQNSCCFFFFCISVATSLNPGYFLSAWTLHHLPNASPELSLWTTNLMPFTHLTTRTSPDSLGGHANHSFSGLRICLQHRFLCVVPSSSPRLLVLSEHLELFLSRLLLLLGMPSLIFHLEDYYAFLLRAQMVSSCGVGFLCLNRQRRWVVSLS